MTGAEAVVPALGFSLLCSVWWNRSVFRRAPSRLTLRYRRGELMVGRFSIKETLQEQGYRHGLIAGLTYELVPVSSANAAIQALPPSSPVSVTCSPVRGIDATVELTDRIRAFGHHPIPHVAARMVEGPEHVARLARWLRTEDIGRLFVIGGDAHRPAGPYSDAFSFLRDLLDADPGLHTVGVPAYPDNHPFIEPPSLHEAFMPSRTYWPRPGWTVLPPLRCVSTRPR